MINEVLGTFLAGGVVLLMAGLAAYSIYNDRRSGKKSCCRSCSGCSGCDISGQSL